MKISNFKHLGIKDELEFIELDVTVTTRVLWQVRKTTGRFTLARRTPEGRWFFTDTGAFIRLAEQGLFNAALRAYQATAALEAL